MNKKLIMDRKGEEYQRLVSLIASRVKQLTASRGKDLKWLKYAKKDGDCYRLLSKKDEQYELLNKILIEVHKEFPQFGKGGLAEAISLYVNGS